ncbi:MAG: dihydrofolate reductase [Myxococcota bacterium]
MRLSIIVAVAQNGVIGVDGDLPWRLPADLRFFKQTTLGHHLLMGRKTWDSIGRALPGRTTVVLTRNPQFEAPGCAVAHDLDAAVDLARAAGDTEAFVAGGAGVYAAALPRADRLYITQVEATVPGDVSFPSYDPAQWSEVARQEHPADEKHRWPFVISTFDRR